jgi:dihydroorotate dehydrogenase
MYKLIRSFFFLFDAEKVHYFAMNALRLFCSIGPLRKFLTSGFKPSANNLPHESWGLEFKNRVGLAAGFDKNAKYLRELEVLGFGFVEIGTVTPSPKMVMISPASFVCRKIRPLLTAWVLIMKEWKL